MEWTMVTVIIALVGLVGVFVKVGAIFEWYDNQYVTLFWLESL